MDRKARIKIIVKREINNYFTYFKFLDNLIQIKDLIDGIYLYDINDDIFFRTNNCIPIEFILGNKANDTKKFIINIYKCLNIFHLYLQECGFTYEIILLDTYLDKKIYNQKKYSTDNNNNIHRKRISLINCNDLILKFDSFNFIPFSHFPSNKINNNSFQFSIYSKEAIISKPNKLLNNGVDISDFYFSNKEQIEITYKQIIDSLNIKTETISNIIEATQKQKSVNNEFNKINFCKSKQELENVFDKKEYIDFFYQILVIKLLIKKPKYLESKESFKNALNKFNEFKEKINLDEDLKIYQKIFGLIIYNYILRKYNCFNTYYIKRKDAKENSVFNHAINFLNSFINELNEESPAFFKLLEINNQYGYFKDSIAYNFNLFNVNDIKEHLREILPDIIFIFNSNCSTKSFSFSQTGSIAINSFYLFQNYEEINLLKNYEKNKNSNVENISMLLSRLLLHELYGHTKYRSKANIKNQETSPIICFSKGKIKALTHIGNKARSKNLIKIFFTDKNNKGDTGHYLETAFGKIKEDYIILYFDKLKDIKKFLKFPEYFIDKNKINILKRYIFLQYIFEQLKLNLNTDNYSNLEDGIIYMESIIKPKIESNEFKINDFFLTKNEIENKINNINNNEEHLLNNYDSNVFLSSSYIEADDLDENNMISEKPYSQTETEQRNENEYIGKKRYQTFEEFKLLSGQDSSENSKINDIKNEQSDDKSDSDIDSEIKQFDVLNLKLNYDDFKYSDDDDEASR
jgi:hypothetical protein